MIIFLDSIRLAIRQNTAYIVNGVGGISLCAGTGAENFDSNSSTKPESVYEDPTLVDLGQLAIAVNKLLKLFFLIVRQRCLQTVVVLSDVSHQLLLLLVHAPAIRVRTHVAIE